MGLGLSKQVENLKYDLSSFIHLCIQEIFIAFLFSKGILLREHGICSSSIFFAVPEQVKHDPTSRPLHWLILLPGMHFFQDNFMTALPSLKFPKCQRLNEAFPGRPI